MNEHNPAKHIPSDDRPDDWIEEYASDANDANIGIQEAAGNIVEAMRDGNEPDPKDLKALRDAIEDMGIALGGLRSTMDKLPGPPQTP